MVIKEESEIALRIRIMSQVDQTETCWNYEGAKNRDGYGDMRINRKTVLTHRAMYKLFVGNIPDNTFVLHQCDNPSCVRPMHLFLGNQKENMQDMIAKGRQNPNCGVKIRGEKCHTAKLTEAQVRQIRLLHSEQKYTFTKLANMFTVSLAEIWRICNKQRWTYLK